MVGKAKVVDGKTRHARNPSGKKKVFVKAEQKFYLQVRMTDPNDPSKLIDFPEGVTVKLMNNGKPIRSPGASALTDRSGKVVLAPDKSTIVTLPSYHFRIDLDERTYYDIDAKKLAAGSTIREFDDRNLMELPMIMDTKSNEFYYDKSKLPLKNGMLKNYPAHKKGEGSPSVNIVLEVRFYWYYLRFKFCDIIRNDVQDIPRGMPLLPLVDGNNHFTRMVKDEMAFGYVINTVEKRALHYLKLLGYFKGKVGAALGIDGKDAIRKFQKQHGLTENGNLDGPTKNMLERVFYRRNTGIYKNAAYWVPVWKKMSAQAEVYFELAKPANKLATEADSASFDLFLHTKDKTATPALVTRKKIAVDNQDKDGNEVPWEKLDFFKKRTYYDLPARWSSRNYWTRHNNDMAKGGAFSEVMKDKVKLYPFANNEANRADKRKPLIFSLDDIVLVKTDGSQDIKDKDASDAAVPLKADTGGNKDGSRLTLFHVKDGDLVVHDPEEASRPYFSKVTSAGVNFTANLVPHVPGNTRVIAFAGDFYDVYHKRTAQKAEPFVPAKHILGARAAVLNDTDCHFCGALRNPGTPVAAVDTGNFELHYLHDCWPIEEPEKCDKLCKRSFLLVYWSGRFSLKDYIGNVTLDAAGNPEQNPDAHGMTAADVTKFETEGMDNAKKRWEDKGYVFEPCKLIADGGTCYHQIKPVFFFEAKKPDIGGKEKCAVEISNDQKAGSMGITQSWMYWPDYKIRNYLGVGEFTDVDGKKYETLVVAHELSHAEGKDDDYSYNDRFKQYYPGMPYQFDDGSMMSDNRAPRMRHLYNFLNWANKFSKVDPNGLKKFFNDAQFAVVHRFGKTTLRFSLPDALKDIYIPFRLKEGHALETGKVDLALYRLGGDETAYNYPIGTRIPRPPKDPYNAILVVYLKICLIFKDGSAGAWSSPEKKRFLTSLTNILKSLNSRFYLEGKGAHDCKRTYLAVFPVCLEKSAPDPDSHYDVEVTLDDSSSIFLRAGKSVKVGNEVNKNWLANYILGDNDGAVSAFFKWTLGLWSLGDDELEFARDWARGELGDDDIDIEDSLW